jgi:SNF2 family DNA or RNA helicase
VFGEVVTGPMWGMKALPHVIMRAKRWFPRADAKTPGVLYLQDTPDVARDIEVFIERYPLKMSKTTRRRLRERAGEHKDREQAITDVLAGHARPNEWKAPARDPRGYQRTAADLVQAVQRIIIADELGLGKTFEALLTLQNPEALPAVVVVKPHLAKQWLRELNKTFPWLLGHIVTSGMVYDPATRKDCAGRTPDVLIITYNKLNGWAEYLAGHVRTIICDEVHELRRGTSSLKGQAAKRISVDALFAVGLSGTPVTNYAGEAHCLYDVLAPDRLGSRQEFLREWGSNAGTLNSDHIKVADPKALGAFLRAEGLLLRRTGKDVHMEMPEPVQVPQDVETDPEVLQEVAGDVEAMARLILDETADARERFTAAGQIDWKLRRATGVAKAPYVAEFINLLLEQEEKVVVWGWHRDVYDILLDKLAKHRPVMYTGTESPKQKEEAYKAFVEGDSRVLIMSLRSGDGLDGLQQVCRVGVFAELDWAPTIHRQCIGRLDRPGQESTVVAYYMVSNEGVDPAMADVLAVKLQQSEPIINPDRDVMAPIGNTVDRAKMLAADVLGRAGGLRPQEDALFPDPELQATG